MGKKLEFAVCVRRSMVPASRRNEFRPLLTGQGMQTPETAYIYQYGTMGRGATCARAASPASSLIRKECVTERV
jgi:hypothetical protein